MILQVPPAPTAHVDTYARELLPPADAQPEYQFLLDELCYPAQVNCVRVLLDDAIEEGHGERIAIHAESGSWTYAELLTRTNQLANVLTADLGVVAGNRVLLRGFNSPMLMAAWLAVIKVGAIAVTTMPLLRSKELGQIGEKARITHALCDARLVEELREAASASGHFAHVATWHDGGLEALMAHRSSEFATVKTSRDDLCLIAFTSGTSGIPKATAHFHRDVLAMADVVGRHLLRTRHDDIYTGSPPLGFTFGLGALLVFPLRFRAASAPVEQPTPDALLDALERYSATCLFTAPTMYRNLAGRLDGRRIGSLRRAVSAGEPLPLATRELWRRATGLNLTDGIGATEMIHIFIATDGTDAPAGSIGRPLPGYTACVVDEDGEPLPLGSTGRLAVKGPTGCRYLQDERQREYVVRGWNVTGDRFHIDKDGYFWFVTRTDDMILSSGYNIAGPEVESALLQHGAVRECAVVGLADAERGQVVTAFIVLQAGYEPTPELAAELQLFVKNLIAPYKYPRLVRFLPALPKTPTGKVQRNELRARGTA